MQHTVFPKAATSRNSRIIQVDRYWAVALISKGFLLCLAPSGSSNPITWEEQNPWDLNLVFEEESISKYVACALISGRNPLYQQHLYTDDYEQATIPSPRSL